MPEYTDSEFWDKIVISYISLRVFLLFCISVLVIPQVFYEYREIYIFKNRKIGPKFITLIALSLFPLFRVADQLSYLTTTPRSGTGTWAWYFGVVSTYFLFMEWSFIGCFWIQLIYTYFVSVVINLRNSLRCWVTVWTVMIILAIWDIGLLIGARIDVTATDRFYRIGFIISVILIGFSIFVHGVILAVQLRSQKKRIQGIERVLKRVLQLSAILGFIIILILCRDTIWSIFKLPHSSPYRHITIFLTAVLEIAQSLVVMLALTNSNFINYFKFKRVSHEEDSAVLSDGNDMKDTVVNVHNRSPISDADFSSHSSAASSSSEKSKQIHNQYHHSSNSNSHNNNSNSHNNNIPPSNLVNEINYDLFDSINSTTHDEYIV